jgi:hypothetical protein
MTAIGRTTWVVPGGNIPLHSTGPEPEFTSRDQLSVLNTGEHQARLCLTIFSAQREPTGPFRLTVPGRRLRQVRINDLIDPEAIPLATDYACTLTAGSPVVVHFSRQHTGQAATAIAGALAIPSSGHPPAPVAGGQSRHQISKEDDPAMPEPIGQQRWVIADGYIPGWSTGPEPEMTSHDTACVLNAEDRPAHIRLTIYFADREPAGPYVVTVPPCRIRHVRFNDLTEPEPVPVSTPFASVIESDVPVVVQHSRLDSRQAENALLSTVAYAT